MNYLLTPPNTHFDYGLGITACNFEYAADTLEKHKSGLDNTLPLSFLRRHAAELYLKSFIYILHRKYKIPFGEKFSLENPAILVGKKWVSLSNTHNILDLFNHFESVFKSVFDLLPSTTRWDLPEDLRKTIELVSGMDPKSTYFRYPIATNSVQDRKKSKMQKFDFLKAIEESKKTGKPVKALIMLGENDEVIDTYDINSDAIPEIQSALKWLCNLFYGVHAAIRNEITRGY